MKTDARREFENPRRFVAQFPTCFSQAERFREKERIPIKPKQNTTMANAAARISAHAFFVA